MSKLFEKGERMSAINTIGKEDFKEMVKMIQESVYKGKDNEKPNAISMFNVPSLCMFKSQAIKRFPEYADKYPTIEQALTDPKLDEVASKIGEDYKEMLKTYFDDNSSNKKEVGLSNNQEDLGRLIQGIYFNQHVLKVNDPLFDKTVDEFCKNGVINKPGAASPSQNFGGLIGEVYIRGILELAGLNVDAPGVENGIDDAGLDLVIYNKQGEKAFTTDIKTRNLYTYDPFQVSWAPNRKYDPSKDTDYKRGINLPYKKTDSAEFSLRDNQINAADKHENDYYTACFYNSIEGCLTVINTVPKEYILETYEDLNKVRPKVWDNRKDNEQTVTYLFENAPNQGTPVLTQRTAKPYITKRKEKLEEKIQKQFIGYDMRNKQTGIKREMVEGRKEAVSDSINKLIVLPEADKQRYINELSNHTDERYVDNVYVKAIHHDGDIKREMMAPIWANKSYDDAQKRQASRECYAAETKEELIATINKHSQGERCQDER